MLITTETVESKFINLNTKDLDKNENTLRQIRGLSVKETRLQGITVKELETKNEDLYYACFNAMIRSNGKFIELPL